MEKSHHYWKQVLKRHTYREIVWQWFVLNRAPHTDWEKAPGEGVATGVAAASL